MAILTLPHPNIDFVPLDILTAAEQNQLVANINALAMFANGLADGTNLSDDIVLPRHKITVKLDSSNYYNSGSNRARLKSIVKQYGNITADVENNEFIIGKGVSEVELFATIMAEGLSTYLYLISQIKKNNSQNYTQIAQSLNAPQGGYAGASIFSSIPVEEGDHISILHDCTGTIRGQYSIITLKAG